MNDEHNQEEELEQEEELKKSLQRIYNNIVIPDSKVSWINAQTRLQKRKLWKRWKRNFTYVAVVFVGLLVVISAMNVSGTYSFSAFIKNIQERVIEFFHEWVDHNESNAKLPTPMERVEGAKHTSNMSKVK